MEEVIIALLILVSISIILMPIVILAKVIGLRRRSDDQAVVLEQLRTGIAGNRETVRARLAGLTEAVSALRDRLEAAPAETSETLFDEVSGQKIGLPEAGAGERPPVETVGDVPPPPPALPEMEDVVHPGAEATVPGGAVSSGAEPVAVVDQSAVYEAPQREKSRFEKTAAETLRKVWNWIVVGEEHRPVDVSVEYAIATNWLLRVGVIVIVMGIGFFLNYSIERDLIGPIGRVGLSILTGLALLVSGIRLLGGRYHLLGQGLTGAGLATLYFSVFAAANFYHLISLYAGFGLMAVITVSAGMLAVRLDSLLVAVLGIIGGFGTPVMISTGEANFVGLFSYLLVLGLGVLGIALRKRWHLLNYLSFIFTYGLFVAAVDQYYEAGDFWMVMPFLAGFFTLFSTMVFIHHLANETKANLLDVFALLANAGLFFWFSYELIAGAYRIEWVAAITLGLTFFYLLHVRVFLGRQLKDRELLVTFTGLSVFFLTVTMPIVLSREWLTSSWSIQALVMLWMAGKLRSQFLRQTAFVVFGFVVFRITFVDLGSSFEGRGADLDLSFLEYLPALLERLVAFLVPVASLGGAAALLRRPTKAFAAQVSPQNDVAGWINENLAIKLGLGFAVGLLFIYLNFELNRTLLFLFPPVRLLSLTILWVCLSFLFLVLYLRSPSRPMFLLFICMATAVVVKLIAIDLGSWRFSGFLYGSDYSVLDAATRTLDFAVIIALLAIACVDLKEGFETAAARLLLAISALGLLFLYATFELNTLLLNFIPGFRAGGITILWALFALAFVLTGIRRSVAPLRFCGLSLFLVVAFKVFFVDLDNLGQIYRIIAFILLGGLILAGSFIYLRYRQFFLKGQENPSQEDQ